jgi:hypothetical protein
LGLHINKKIRKKNNTKIKKKLKKKIKRYISEKNIPENLGNYQRLIDEN